MPSVRSLRNKIKSVGSIKQFTSAMRAVSTAKFSRTSDKLRRYKRYVGYCRQVAKQSGISMVNNGTAGIDLYVVFTANRTLCGEFNNEIVKFCKDSIPVGSKVFVCGNWAKQHFGEKCISFDSAIEVSDVPEYTEAEKLYSEILAEFYVNNVDNVYFVYSKFENMMKQTPAMVKILPAGEDAVPNPDVTFIPDKASVSASVTDVCLTAEIYPYMLEAALSAQAATMMAMRSASENAQTLYADLQLELGRLRQSIITTDVIETSSRAGDERLGD